MYTCNNQTKLLKMIFALVLLLVPEYIGAVPEILRDRTDLKVKTPKYPGNYPGNSTRVWRFKQSAGIWSINIERFFLQNTNNCEDDYLEITDFTTGKISTFCGRKQSGNLYVTKGPEVLLKFKSDGAIQQMGFHLEVVHLFTEDDVEKTLKEMEKRSSKAKVVMNTEETLTDSWIFYTLVGVLGLALIVFIILLACCIVSISKKNRRSSKRRYQKNVVFQDQILTQNGRRYSKSKTQPVSSNVTDARSPTRYV